MTFKIFFDIIFFVTEKGSFFFNTHIVQFSFLYNTRLIIFINELIHR